MHAWACDLWSEQCQARHFQVHWAYCRDHHGLMASTVAMQFYNFPNLLSGAMFPKSSSISLSLTDAVGFFATAQMFAMNSWIVGKYGWSASWMFLAAIFGIGGRVMLNAIPTVLHQAERNTAR